jgi:hypothetical protein
MMTHFVKYGWVKGITEFQRNKSYNSNFKHQTPNTKHQTPNYKQKTKNKKQ